MIAAAILCPVMFWLNGQMEQGEEWAKITTSWMWLASFATTTIVQAPWPKEQRINVVPRLLFAPFVLIIFIIFWIVKPFCKTYQKR